MKSFDRVAGAYQALEYIAFGRSLETARHAHAARLRDCRNVLVIGEGDGRFLERFLRVAPHAHVRCIDSSPEMVARAGRRLGADARTRVSFVCGDARTADMEPSTYDAVVTLFVLDCLPPEEVARLGRRLARSLQPEGLWLFADFAIPARGWRRLRASAWVSVLYAFFRWQTGLSVRSLPPSEAILGSIGLRVLADRTFQHGLLRAVLYSKNVE